jgi:hypothetical protein
VAIKVFFIFNGIQPQKFKGDKAYIGEKNVTTPHKKPKKRELSEIQKQENKAFSSSRIIIEHTIGLVKVSQIATQRFRLRPLTKLLKIKSASFDIRLKSTITRKVIKPDFI